MSLCMVTAMRRPSWGNIIIVMMGCDVEALEAVTIPGVWEVTITNKLGAH